MTGTSFVNRRYTKELPFLSCVSDGKCLELWAEPLKYYTTAEKLQASLLIYRILSLLAIQASNFAGNAKFGLLSSC